MNCRHKIFLSQIRALTACLRKRKFAVRIKALGLLNMQYKDVITYAKIRRIHIEDKDLFYLYSKSIH